MLKARMKYLSKIPFDDLAPNQKREFLQYKTEMTGAEWENKGPMAERTHPPEQNMDNICERLPRSPISSPQVSLHALAKDEKQSTSSFRIPPKEASRTNCTSGILFIL